MILRCEGLIENIVECKGRIFRMCYLDGMRLIENIVECKVCTATPHWFRRGRLIENIVECKVDQRDAILYAQAWINRKHSGM